jgi:hypothetical protein
LNLGQLGHGDKTNRLFPTMVNGLAGKKIIAIAACMYHSLAVDVNGTVWTWGTNSISGLPNDFGWLGGGDVSITDSYVPRAIPAGILPTDVTSVHCGKFHSVVLTKSGQVWVWYVCHYNHEL